MRVLDLFCCAGGAGTGYARAGFQVTGVDIVQRDAYPFDFIREDALDVARRVGWTFDLIHASPPCQASVAITKGTNAHLSGRYEDLFDETLETLEGIGVPYIIENPRSRPDVVLCGEMFGLGVIRHRKFQLGSWSLMQPQHKSHRGRVRGYRHGQWFDGPYVAAYGRGGGKASVKEMQEAMGINWTDSHEELREAIPPAYTQLIGREFIMQGELQAA